MRVVTDADQAQWERFVAGCKDANIFHTPMMHEVFSGACRCVPRAWAVLDTKDRIRAIIPSVEMSVFDGVARSWTTRTVLHGGMLWDREAGFEEAVHVLLQAYSKQVSGKTLFTECRNLADAAELQPLLQKCGFTFEPHLNFLIDLSASESELWHNIRPNARRNIRKARKLGVIVDEVTDAARMGAVSNLLKSVYKRIQVALPDPSLFESAFRVLYPREMIRVLIARQGDVDIGTLILLKYRRMIHYWYTGTLQEYFSCRPADLLVWHALRLGKEMGCEVFDFGGAGRPDEVYRVRDFKAKFGGTLVNYGRNISVHAPLRLKVSRAGYGLMKRFL